MGKRNKAENSKLEYSRKIITTGIKPKIQTGIRSNIQTGIRSNTIESLRFPSIIS